jgi:predicted hydrolase (HD superfamily)
MLAVEAIMRSAAKHLGESEESWGILGLLHDVDYEKTEGTPEGHGLLATKKLKDKDSAEELTEKES